MSKKIHAAPTLFGAFELPEIRTLRIPYQGSKNAISTRIIGAILTHTDNHNQRRFVDAFCGGGGVLYGLAQTHMFRSVLGNDINRELIELHRNLPDLDLNYIARTPCILRPNKAVQGRYPFVKLIDEIDPIYQMAFRIVGSFGNDCRTNLWGKEMIVKYLLAHQLFHEPEKVGETIASHIGADAINYPYLNETISGRYDEYKRHVGLFRENPKGLDELQQLERLQQLQRLEQLERLQQLQQLEQLERLQQLEQLERLQRLEQLEQLEQLEFTHVEYNDIEYKESDVVYFDPPYRNTAGYSSGAFDSDRFEDFARSLKAPVFISEYQPEIRGFTPILKIAKRNILSATSNTLAYEYLHWNGIR